MSEPLDVTEVISACLREAGGDVDVGLAAAEYILLSSNPTITPVKKVEEPPSIPLSHDIRNRRAQGILNRSLQAVKGLNVTARRELSEAVKKSRSDSGQAILSFVSRYRRKLAALLTNTQLAALLEGAREVAEKAPALALFPGAVPPPPTLEPEKAVKLVERLSKLPEEERAKAVYNLPKDQQVYVEQAIQAKRAAPPPPAIPPVVRRTPGEDPSSIHFPVIEEAVKTLSEKNVVDRQRYDTLDALTRAKAFTVAGVEAEETLAKVRDSLAENIKEGVDYETWRKKVMDDLDQGTFLSDAHQETVFRTNVQSALSDGQEMVLQHPLVRSGFPYRQRDAIHDDRVRKNHAALERLGIQGTNIYRADDPVWQTFRVPWDYNDRCADTPLTVRQAAEAGIEEAQKWLETGVEPTDKAWVQMPDFQPPPGFQRSVAAMPLSIQLSMQSVAVFSLKEGKPEEETDSSLLYGIGAEVGSTTGGALDTAKEGNAKQPKMKVKRAKTARGRRVRRSIFRRLRVKARWKKKDKSAPSLSVNPPQNAPQDGPGRVQLIAEILVALFGRNAERVAQRLASKMQAAPPDQGDINGAFALPFARPKGWYQSPTPPRPNWVLVYTSPRGAKWWASPKNAGNAPPQGGGGGGGGGGPPSAPKGPIPQPQQVQQQAVQLPPPPAPTPVSHQVGVLNQHMSPYAAFTAAMYELQAGRRLSSSDRLLLAGHLPNLGRNELKTLHAALGAGGVYGIKAQIVAKVQSVLIGSAAPPAPRPPSKPAASPSAPPTPKAAPAQAANKQPQQVGPSTFPYQDETDWETGKPQTGQVLNGVPFAPAPPKFWEQVKDVDVKEPAPVSGKKVDRVGILIQEPDGRIWIVQPTNQFGGRKYTLPGGRVEPGLTNQQNALKEVWEETGIQCEVTGYLGDFEDSNNGNNGRLYIGKRVGGAPWDAKPEPHITPSSKNGSTAESEAVTLVTPEKAYKLLHRTDDLAQLMAHSPPPIDFKSNGNAMKKLVAGLAPKIKEYKNAQYAAGQSTGESTLHAVQELRGFNGAPQVVDSTTFDSLISQGGHIEMMRGLSSHYSGATANQLAENFRTGDHYPGFGCFGSGTYCDSNKGIGNVAIVQYKGHGKNGAVLRIALPKTAKIINNSDLEKSVPSYPSNFSTNSSHGNNSSWKGIQAALAGYDAIYIDGKSLNHGNYGKGFYVILNRSICTVQREDASTHVIR